MLLLKTLCAPHTAGMLLKVSVQLPPAVRCKEEEKTLMELLVRPRSLHICFDKM